jgi:hypothetical protein
MIDELIETIKLQDDYVNYMSSSVVLKNIYFSPPTFLYSEFLTKYYHCLQCKVNKNKYAFTFRKWQGSGGSK